MQGVWSPTDNFTFYGTYAYNNRRFEGGAYDGNRFRLSPDHAFSLGMDVQWPFLGGEVYFRPTYTWQSKVFFDDNNDEAFFQQAPPKFVADNIIDEFQESYGLLNARLGFTPGEGNWEVELYADNLLDYRYVIDAGNTGDAFGMATWILSAAHDRRVVPHPQVSVATSGRGSPIPAIPARASARAASYRRRR